MAKKLISVKLPEVLAFLQLLQNNVCQTSPGTCHLEKRPLKYDLKSKSQMPLNFNEKESQCQTACIFNTQCFGMMYIIESQTCILISEDQLVEGTSPIGTKSYVKLCDDSAAGYHAAEDGETPVTLSPDGAAPDSYKQVPGNRGRVTRTVSSTSTHPATLWMYVYGGATAFVGMVLMISSYFVVSAKPKKLAEEGEEDAPQAMAFNIMMPDFLLPEKHRRRRRRRRKSKHRKKSNSSVSEESQKKSSISSLGTSTIPSEVKRAAEAVGGKVYKAKFASEVEDDSEASQKAVVLKHDKDRSFVIRSRPEESESNVTDELSMVSGESSESGGSEELSTVDGGTWATDPSKKIHGTDTAFGNMGGIG